MAFSIIGFSPTYLVPKFAAVLVFGAGAISASNAPLVCLCVGMKTTAGSMVADQDVVQATSQSDCDTYAGPGSQLARMGYKALGAATNTTVLLAACAEPSGVAATVTLAIAGTWTTAGTWQLAIAGEALSGAILSTDTPTTLAANIAAAINAQTRWPVTAASTAGTLTITVKNKGLQSNYWAFWWDPTLLSSGLTYTLTGGSTLGSNPNRVTFGATAGTGTESVVNILTKLQNKRYARIAAGQADATNAPLWASQLAAKAAPTVLLLDQIIFATNRAYSAAQTLAQTTLNNQRATVLWAQNSEMHPCELAATIAGARATIEQTTLVYDFDGYVLPNSQPLRFDADNPLDAAQNTALQNGVTPLTTSGSGLAVVRGITTYCLTASEPDYRTIDWGDVVVPDQFALDLQAKWYLQFKVDNPLVGDDPGPTDPLPESGIAYPKLWTQQVNGLLGTYYDAGWINDPTEAPPSGYFDDNAERIMESITLLVRRVQHQIGNQILQNNSQASP